MQLQKLFILQPFRYWKYLEDSTKVASGKLTLVGILKNVVGNVNYEVNTFCAVVQELSQC